MEIQDSSLTVQDEEASVTEPRGGDLEAANVGIDELPGYPDWSKTQASAADIGAYNGIGLISQHAAALKQRKKAKEQRERCVLAELPSVAYPRTSVERSQAVLCGSASPSAQSSAALNLSTHGPDISAMKNSKLPARDGESATAQLQRKDRSIDAGHVGDDEPDDSTLEDPSCARPTGKPDTRLSTDRGDNAAGKVEAQNLTGSSDAAADAAGSVNVQEAAAGNAGTASDKGMTAVTDPPCPGMIPNRTRTTITPTPTGVGPNTYNLNGSILTSPSVYVSFFDVIYNAVSSNQTVNYVTNTLMAFRPTDIKSQRGYHGSNGNYSFNYADLPLNPVPSSALFGQADCLVNKDGCVPMETTSYAPALAFPSVFYQLSDINPKWTGKSCMLMGNYKGIWVPPVACQPTSSAAGPGPAPVAYTTSSSSSQSSQAKPSSTPTQSPPQTSTRGAQTSSSQSTQSSYTAEAESTESTSSTNAPPESSYAESTSSSVLNTQPSDPTSPMSSSDPRTASTKSSNDVGGIIASAIGMTQTSTDPTTAGDASSQQITEGSSSSGASSGSSADPAGMLASVLGHAGDSSDITGTVVQDPSTQDSSVADPVTAALTATLRSDTDPASNPAQTYNAVFTLDGSTVSAMVQPSGHLVISGTTLAPGQTISFGGQAVSLNSDGAIIAGTSTIVPITTGGVSDPAEQTAIFTLSGSTVSAMVQPSGHLVISGTTLAPGQTISFGGQAVSLNSDGAIIAGTSTIVPITTGGVSDPAEQTAIFTLSGSTVSAMVQPSGHLVISGTTLAPGQTISFGGQAVSLNSDGAIIAGTSTIVPITTGGVSDPAEQTAIFTLSGSTVSAMVQPSGHLVISGTTLAPGQTISFGGQAVSLNSDGAIIAGTSTIVPMATGGVSDLAEKTAIFTAGGSIYTAIEQATSFIVIGQTTLSAGGSAVTLGGNGAVAKYDARSKQRRGYCDAIPCDERQCSEYWSDEWRPRLGIRGGEAVVNDVGCCKRLVPPNTGAEIM
ncbi:hypothetical protein B0A55_12598, partial [Friedmanniomyces simplex]